MQMIFMSMLVAITCSSPLQLNPGKNASFEAAQPSIKRSPVLIEAQKRSPGDFYTMVKRNVECHSGDRNFGYHHSLEDCANKCRYTTGCEFFIYGQRNKYGNCWQEFTRDETCSEGWEADNYNFYKLDEDYHLRGPPVATCTVTIQKVSTGAWTLQGSAVLEKKTFNLSEKPTGWSNYDPKNFLLWKVKTDTMKNVHSVYLEGDCYVVLGDEDNSCRWVNYEDNIRLTESCTDLSTCSQIGGSVDYDVHNDMCGIWILYGANMYKTY